MSEQIVTNPLGAFRRVTDFRTGVDADGEVLAYGNTTRPFRANAAIGRGEVVMWVEPTATVPLSVTPMTAAAADNLFAGVAAHAAAAGDVVDVVVEGHCLVDVAAETAAFGSVLTAPGTTTGKAEIGATIDATLVAGSIIGIALGAKDSSNLAAAYIGHR